MKKQLLKKLSAFIVTAMMFSTSVNAQIVYTDVNPDTTIAGLTYYLDLNNDGTIDDSISRFSSRASHGICHESRVSISALDGNAVASSTYPLAMNLYDTISSGLTWSASGNLREVRSAGDVGCPSDTSGNWTNSIDHYLGLKLIVGTDTYYGWGRMQITVFPFTTSCIIKDYAYNSTPNQFILAGDTGLGTTGIFENIASLSINLFPNPSTNQLTIALRSNNRKVEVTIADITGKIIYSTTASETQKIEVNTKDFAKGIYVVQIQTGEFIGTKKFVVEK